MVDSGERHAGSRTGPRARDLPEEVALSTDHSVATGQRVGGAADDLRDGGYAPGSGGCVRAEVDRHRHGRGRVVEDVLPPAGGRHPADDCSNAHEHEPVCAGPADQVTDLRGSDFINEGIGRLADYDAAIRVDREREVFRHRREIKRVIAGIRPGDGLNAEVIEQERRLHVPDRGRRSGGGRANAAERIGL